MLKAIEALIARVSPGPFKVQYGAVNGHPNVARRITGKRRTIVDDQDGLNAAFNPNKIAQVNADAEFLAKSRVLLPAAIRAVKELCMATKADPSFILAHAVKATYEEMGILAPDFTLERES